MEEFFQLINAKLNSIILEKYYITTTDNTEDEEFLVEISILLD